MDLCRKISEVCMGFFFCLFVVVFLGGGGGGGDGGLHLAQMGGGSDKG